MTYDDPGLVLYSDTYINSLLPMMASKAIPLSIAVVTGGSYSQSIISEVQGWINAGWDINTHSISHEYWDPPAASCGTSGPFPVPCHAFEGLQYTGNIATSVTLNISHPAPGQALMTVTTSPDDPAADINWNMTPAAPGQRAEWVGTRGTAKSCASFFWDTGDGIARVLRLVAWCPAQLFHVISTQPKQLPRKPGDL